MYDIQIKYRKSIHLPVQTNNLPVFAVVMPTIKNNICMKHLGSIALVEANAVLLTKVLAY